MSGRDTLKHLYFRMLGLTGADRRLLGNIRKQDLLVILNLHQVSPASNPFWPPLEPRVFDELLSFLKQHFVVSNFANLATVTDARPCAVLSFDDGYYNFVEYAMPILDKHGLAANLNVIPGCVDSGEPPWNVRLYDFLNSVPRKLINEIRLPGFESQLADDGADAKVRYGLQISRFLKNRPRRERIELWAEVSEVMERALRYQIDTHDERGRRSRQLRRSMRSASILIRMSRWSLRTKNFSRVTFSNASLTSATNCVCRWESMRFLTAVIDPNKWIYLDQQGIERILLVGEDYARRDQKVLPRFTVYGASPAEASIRALGYAPQSINRDKN